MEKVYIIAEIGVNHNGNISIAKKLIKIAKKSGADAVKFQTYDTKYYINKSEKERFAKLKSFELTKKDFKKLSIS